MDETRSQEHIASAPPTINVTPLIDVLLVLLIDLVKGAGVATVGLIADET